MTEGDILIAKIPQDISVKIRPVLFLRRLPSYNDILVCAISTQQHQLIKDFDILLSEASPEFKSTGLLKASVIRLSALAELSLETIPGSIGKVSNSHLQMLKNKLASYLLRK
ncbi:MAG: type II toxin-antitoxin system PemK/MazF family toxin [Ferruginibacter sp.]